MNSAEALVPDVFVLLDDAGSGSSPDSRHSRFYSRLRQEIVCRDAESVDGFFQAIDAALAAGLRAVGFFSYEFGHLLHGLALQPASAPPLARVLMFEHCEHWSAADVGRWLQSRTLDASYALESPVPAFSEAAFTAQVETIRRYIEAGETYQINLTFPLRFRTHGDPLALYAALRARQPVPFGALAALPDGSHVLSLSPELFVSHRRGQLRCKPMKGTARAQGDSLLDEQQSIALAGSTKERAENLMIVYLLRNDLGRIAETGSVSVRDLFAVERFGGVLQMTSTIEARLRAGASLSDCFAALYPCGSITGAPKRRSMQILQSLEQAPRGLYTGAIGWFDPPSSLPRPGDFTLSVPIRTLVLQPPTAGEMREGEMGVGAGITYDSTAQAEYQECLLKAAFLTGLPPGFDLFETMHATRAGIRHHERHLARLVTSAMHFGFALDKAELRRRMVSACEQLPDHGEYRLRLSLSPAGKITITHAPLVPLTTPVKLLLSDTTTYSDDHFLKHKTSIRRLYDQGWQQAEAVGAFDSLFCNERGELTEGGRSNLFIKLKGRWFTPPLSAGLLPGVMRSVMLEDDRLNATECSLTLDDLAAAEEVAVCNALRGWLRAEVFFPSGLPRSELVNRTFCVLRKVDYF